MKFLSNAILVGFLIPVGATAEYTSAQRALANSAYEVGTDIGGQYLREFGVKLRTLVLLGQCGEAELYGRLGAIPASFDYFMRHDKSKVFVGNDKLIAAQVTNGFLLGYQFAVRYEFQIGDSSRRAELCQDARALARASISGDSR